MSGDFLDRAAQVRDDEALPLDRLVPWIADHLGVTGQPQVTQFTGGASNWTYRLAYPDADLICAARPPGRGRNPPMTWAANTGCKRR